MNSFCEELGVFEEMCIIAKIRLEDLIEMAPVMQFYSYRNADVFSVANALTLHELLALWGPSRFCQVS